MMLPIIGSKGAFGFLDPFNEKKYVDIEYTVISIRSLEEIIDSDEDPLSSIYTISGMDVGDYEDDLKNKIPIVVLRSGSGKYLYVPADRISTVPQVSGIKYRDNIIGIPLLNLPLDYDFANLTEDLIDLVYDKTGINTKCSVKPVSAVYLVDEDKHRENELLLEHRKSVVKSYRTRYYEIDLLYKNALVTIAELEKMIKNTKNIKDV